MSMLSIGPTFTLSLMGSFVLLVIGESKFFSLDGLEWKLLALGGAMLILYVFNMPAVARIHSGFLVVNPLFVVFWVMWCVLRLEKKLKKFTQNAQEISARRT